MKQILLADFDENFELVLKIHQNFPQQRGHTDSYQKYSHVLSKFLTLFRMLIYVDDLVFPNES